MGDRTVGADASVEKLAAALSPAAAGGAARRSRLAEFERVKDIAPVLRAADVAISARVHPSGGWEEFYSAVMRTR